MKYILLLLFMAIPSHALITPKSQAEVFQRILISTGASAITLDCTDSSACNLLWIDPAWGSVNLSNVRNQDMAIRNELKTLMTKLNNQTATMAELTRFLFAVGKYLGLDQ